MKGLISILSILFVLMVSGGAFAAQETQKGFVKIAKDHELFVDYVAPQEGQPTIVVLNGLTYSTLQWDRFVAPLIKRGVGVLRYDMTGMGETLLKYAPITKVITSDDQVQDLKKLLTVMDLKGPLNFVGLSYGGGIAIAYAAAYPADVANLIVMAPYTEPLADQDNWIKGQIWATRQILPFSGMSDDELYDFYLHQIVYATYPQAEPVVLKNPFILEAVYRMAQGIRMSRPIDLADKLSVPTHLMMGVQDQYIPAAVLAKFWDKVPAKVRESRLFINGSEHKIPEAVPNFAAAWVYQIITGNKLLIKGLDFQGYPAKGDARSGTDTIRLTGGKE
jgi:pimeloyl-ACP methyl ester carboxylesterase